MFVGVAVGSGARVAVGGTVVAVCDATGVLVGLVDRVTGARWPPVTAREEGSPRPWGCLEFGRISGSEPEGVGATDYRNIGGPTTRVLI